MGGHGSDDAGSHGHGDCCRAHADAHDSGQDPGKNKRRHVRAEGKADGGLRCAGIAEDSAEAASGGENDEHIRDGLEGFGSELTKQFAAMMTPGLNVRTEREKGGENGDKERNVGTAYEAENLVD